jgi:hypothetical protein
LSDNRLPSDENRSPTSFQACFASVIRGLLHHRVGER